MVNTDQYSSTMETSDRTFRVNSGMEYRDLFAEPQNQPVRNYIAGRSVPVACLDCIGDSRYGFVAANYGGPVKLYEMDPVTSKLRDMVPVAGIRGTTGGRAMVARLIVSGSAMDVFLSNEMARASSLTWRGRWG